MAYLSQFCPTSHRTRITSVSFYRTTFYSIMMSIHSAINSFLVPSRLSPYAKFKMALKIKRSSKTISKSIRRFLDFCKFEGLDIEQKAIKFCDSVKLKLTKLEYQVGLIKEESTSELLRFTIRHKLIKFIISLNIIYSYPNKTITSNNLLIKALTARYCKSSSCPKNYIKHQIYRL